jgi:hypothetical protein
MALVLSEMKAVSPHCPFRILKGKLCSSEGNKKKSERQEKGHEDVEGDQQSKKKTT